MTNLKMAWLPAGQLNQAQRKALAVQTASKPNASLHRSLLAQRLQQLVDASPQEARQALELSQEQAPELWEIGENVSPPQWGQALASSETFNRLLSLVDWTKTGSVQDSLPEASLWEILETVA